VYWTYMSDDRRSAAQNGPVPGGVAPKIARCGVASLANGTTIHCGSRLASLDFGQQRSDQSGVNRPYSDRPSRMVEGVVAAEAFVFSVASAARARRADRAKALTLSIFSDCRPNWPAARVLDQT